MDLKRVLASQGFGTRRFCTQLVLDGRVTVNGLSAANPDEEFDPAGLEFTVDNEKWLFRHKVYVMVNKPAGFECSHKPEFHPSVYRLLPGQFLERGVQSVGRLDEDTTGLLLFSDDGQFIHRYTSPKKHIVKVYEAELKHEVSGEHVARLLSGVKLLDEATPVAAIDCEIAGDRMILMSVTEGKYHLVKRMVAAAGNRVLRLKRTRIGGLSLPYDLEAGSWRWLEEAELQSLAN